MFDESGDFLYHYTPLETALEHILPRRQLRLNPFARMRDPRESHMWGAGASVPEPTPEDDELFYELSEHVNLVKSTIKVLSMTHDDPNTRSPETRIFGRGFAHPRLWEHYASNHRGFCLCLDKTSFINQINKDLASAGQLEVGEVDYKDGAIAKEALHFNLDDVRGPGVRDAVAGHLAAHHRELFFKKAVDWQTEAEFRIVLRTDHSEPVYVSIGQALRYVVLGARVPAVYIPALSQLCSPIAATLLHIRWLNGSPDLYPVA